MDAKTSPLAMLAKTCSQIGADPMPPVNKLNQNNRKKNSPELAVSVKFSETSRSRSSSTEIRVTDMMSNLKSKSPKSVVPPVQRCADVLRSSLISATPSATPSTTPSATTSNNPGVNNPFLASFASSLSDSIPSTVAASSACRDPLCRDPMCPTAVRNQQLMASAASYNSLMASYPHYKETMLAYAAQQRMAAAAAALAAGTPPGSAGGTLPYVCNWVAGTFTLMKIII